MTEPQVEAVALTAEQTAILMEIADNYRAGLQLWKWLVKLGAVVGGIAAFMGSFAMAWQAFHGK